MPPASSSHALCIALVPALAVALLAACAGRTERAASAASGDAPAPSAEVPAGDVPGAPAPRRWSFSEGVAAALPAGFTPAGGRWGLAARGGLLQSAQNERPVFNVVLIDDTNYADVDIVVRVEAVDGEIDRGGGPLWRAQDADNYYVARWNPLEDNYRVYKVVDGVRTQLGGAATEPGAAARTLHVRMVGSVIECSLDDEPLLRVEDTTFPAAGKVGLWAKADARTLFRDLEVGSP